MTLTTLRRTERPTGDAMLDAHRALGQAWGLIWMFLAGWICALTLCVAWVVLL